MRRPHGLAALDVEREDTGGVHHDRERAPGAVERGVYGRPWTQ